MESRLFSGPEIALGDAMRLARLLIPMAFLPLAWCQAPPGPVFSRVLPVLSGGSPSSGLITAIAVDAAGNTYLAGSTENPAFPVTPDAPQTAIGGGTCGGGTWPWPGVPYPPVSFPCDDAFVVKLDPHGDVLFGTYLGGQGFDRATSIAVDAAGNIYVAGLTDSAQFGAPHGFPTTPGSPFPSSANCCYAFLAKLNPATGLVYSYLMPGLNGASSSAPVLLAVDAQGSVYFAGAQNGFTPTPGALQGKGGIVVGKLNPAGTVLTYGAQFGGPVSEIAYDEASGLAIDSSGNAYVTGYSYASDFPVTAGAFQTARPNGGAIAFVAKLNPLGSALVYATYLGGSGYATQIRVDARGEAYVYGMAESSDFPLTPGAYPTVNDNAALAGVFAGFKPDGSGLVFSTYVAGVFGIANVSNPVLGYGGSFDVDSAGNVFLAGSAGTGLPMPPGATRSCPGGGSDMYAAKVAPDGKLAAATYLGGSGADQATLIAVDPDGTVTVVGTTMSTDFPITTGVDPVVEDYVVARLRISDTSLPDAPCLALALENAASQMERPIAPGELVTLRGNHFGPDLGFAATVDSSGLLPTSLGGVQVFFDGTPAPPLYVQAQQINAQAPFELAGRQSTAVHVEYRSVASQTAQIQVRDAAPDFFRKLPSTEGVIFNSDGSPNTPSNPAPVGSEVWILGTGGGAFTPPLTTGTMTPMAPLSQLAQPVQMWVDGFLAQVVYAGSSPTAPSGVFQINFVVPPVPASAGTHFVEASVGDGPTSSLQAVAIAIKP
jgi:uncharacterized protein (TIGR03437 family)